MLTRLQPFFDERFVFATLTQLKKTSTAPYKKVQIRPFLQGGELTFQLTYVYDKKVLHENLSAPEAADWRPTKFCESNSRPLKQPRPLPDCWRTPSASAFCTPPNTTTT